jgi:hypothetical protein
VPPQRFARSRGFDPPSTCRPCFMPVPPMGFRPSGFISTCRAVPPLGGHALLQLVRRPLLQGFAPCRSPCSGTRLEQQPSWASASLGDSPFSTGTFRSNSHELRGSRAFAGEPLLFRALPTKKLESGSLEPSAPFEVFHLVDNPVLCERAGSGSLLGNRVCCHTSVVPSASHDLSLPELAGSPFR